MNKLNPAGALPAPVGEASLVLAYGALEYDC